MNNEKYNQIIDEVYKNYRKFTHDKNEKNGNFGEYSRWGDNPLIAGVQHLTKESFILRCKIDTEFSKKWGLKIEERELTTVKERKKYDNYFDDLIGEYPEHHATLDKRGVPRKLITITYNNETIEIYE